MTEKSILLDSHYIIDVLPADTAATAFDALQQELEWSEMFHKGGAVPRLVCIQGEIDQQGVQPLYRHPADEQPPLRNWTTTVRALRDVVSQRLEQPLNHVLIQMYRHGDDYISEHADKTLDIQRGTNIVNLSLGASRTMILRPKKDALPKGQSRPSTRIRLDHGSIFVLGWETNRGMTHEIRRDKRPEAIKAPNERDYGGVRISLTFRTVATFLRPDGTLFGQGAPAQVARPASQAEEDLLLQAFSTENHQSNFDWDEIYGRGFSVVNFNITNIASSSTGAIPGRAITSIDESKKIVQAGKDDTSRIALLVIDLQNDFLNEDPSFFFGQRGSPLKCRRQALLQRIGSLADQVRSLHGHVIFIRSIYGQVPVKANPYPHTEARNGLDFNPPFLAGTHAGKTPCCVRGTPGADLYPDAAALVQEGDLCIEKQYYSSFTGTTLEPFLKQLGVRKLMICGVTVNNCVSATVRDAFHLGYDVVVPADGTAHVNPDKQADALEKLKPYCISILPPLAPIQSLLTDGDENDLPCAVSRKKLTWDGTKRMSGLGAGDSLLVPNFLPEAEADEILQKLLPTGELDWNILQNVKHGSTLPRLTAYQSSRNEYGHIPAYRCADPQPWHGQYETKPWSPTVKHVRELVQKAARHGFNWSRILCYRDGQDGMGFHSDKCLDIRDGSYIASLSLGQTREYELKPKVGAKHHPALLPQKIVLRHNTLFLLGPETNRLFLHSVKKSNGTVMQPRLSVTFRDLATWYVSKWKLPAFYGQGTPFVDYQDLKRSKRNEGIFNGGLVIASASVTFLAVARKSQSWLALLAAGVAAGTSNLLLRWKEHRNWQQEQSQLAEVYRQCNIQPLTPAQAKDLLPAGVHRDLSVQSTLR